MPSDPARRKAHPWASVAVAALALVPYATIKCPHEKALLIQAGMLVVIVVVTLLLGRRPWQDVIGRLPHPLAWGLLLYTGAALWGAVVGVSNGNSLRYLGGQLLCMLLLPGATLAFERVEGLSGARIAGGLGVAVVIALALHVGLPTLDVVNTFGGGVLSLTSLPYDVGFRDLAPLVLLLCLGWWLGTRAPLGAIATVAAAVMLVGGMSRAAWVVTSVGAVVVLALPSPDRAAVIRRGAVLAASVALLALGLLVWSETQTHPILESDFRRASGQPHRPGAAHGDLRLETPTRRSWRLAAVRVPPGDRAFEVSTDVRAPAGQWFVLWVTGVDGRGETVLPRRDVATECSGDWQHVARVLALPSAVDELQVGVRLPRGRVEIAKLKVVTLRTTLAAAVREVELRASSLTRAASTPGSVGTLRYRIAEKDAIVAVWRESGWLTRALGRGLGALYPFENVGWSDSGLRVHLPVANYIHNYYLFLLFKLGLAGIVAFTGLVAIAVWLARLAMGRRRAWWFVGSVAAAWVTYLLWSVTSPEILDFRVVPVWGVVLAAAARSDERVPASCPSSVVHDPDGDRRVRDAAQEVLK
jgi:O-antigen ligase